MAFEIRKKRGPTSAIEKVDLKVIDKIFELLRTTDLSPQKIADVINSEFSLSFSRTQIHNFMKKQLPQINEETNNLKSLGMARARLYVEHYGALAKDIKMLDKELDILSEEEMLEPDKRAKAIGDLIDKKGKLLMRNAKLSGKFNGDHGNNIGNMQVNVIQQISEERADIIRQLKRADFRKKR